MTKIYAPNKQYSGLSASVRFVDGVGETDNSILLEWFREHGYKVEDPEQAVEKTTDEVCFKGHETSGPRTSSMAEKRKK